MMGPANDSGRPASFADDPAGEANPAVDRFLRAVDATVREWITREVVEDRLARVTRRGDASVGRPAPPAAHGGAFARRGVPTRDEPLGGFWAELTAQERTALLDFGAWATFAAGGTVFVEGDASEHVFVLWRGYVKVLAQARGGRSVLLAVRGPGDVVGELASVDGGRRSATVAAVEDARALVVDAAAFRTFLDRFPHASSVLRRVLVMRLREAEQHRLASRSLTVAQRLAILLLALAERFGVQEPGGTRVAIALAQEDLATCVGASRRTVARALETWRDRGVISAGRRHVVIRQPLALRRVAESHPPPAEPDAPPLCGERLTIEVSDRYATDEHVRYAAAILTPR
jgi:CRP/FNR family transcriptional regulator, cyclic AMP receptor protein